MRNNFFDGIKFGFGFLFVLGILSGLVYATGFHTANEVIDGSFLGDYSFLGNVNFTGATVSGISVGGIPSGFVGSFNLSTCPAGWSAYTLAEGNVVVGVGGLQNYALESTGGTYNETLTIAQIPSHGHTATATNVYNHVGDFVSSSSGISMEMETGRNNLPETSDPGIVIGLTGDGESHNNVQPYVALLYCIKN